LSNAALLPLVVDLDGTLIKTDLLAETASRFLVEQPFRFFTLLVWLAKGKSALKTHLSEAIRIDVATLPYNVGLIDWLRQQKELGRSIVLATASHRVLAEQVAHHLDLFDEVLATDATTNLTAGAKRDALVSRYGERGFDYVGNDWPDVPVWKSAAVAHVTGGSKRLIDKARAQGNLGRVLDDGMPPISSALLRSMRPHQWVKNLLIFIPLLTANRYGDSTSALQALLAFVVFGFTASSVYLLNDLVDVVDDRQHSRKRFRPFAAGHLSLIRGWLAWPLLAATAFILAGMGLPWQFTVSLATYFAVTLAYSLRLKQEPMVDVLTLAALYTLRIIAGAAAIAVPLSFWLLSFSVFVFLSLAFMKRFSELRAARAAGWSTALRGRGYQPEDLELVSSLGGTAGYIAVLVLALYIQDSHTASLYATPAFMWLACPLLLFWISRAWLLAHRGRMHDDPIVFALKDRVSWAVAALFALVFALAKVVS
jgi:4-hydroxybenzoate polyprenyltransferase/phosphoserine phosphatase